MTDKQMKKLAEELADKAEKADVVYKSAPSAGPPFFVPYGQMFQYGVGGATIGALASLLADVLKNRQLSISRSLMSALLGGVGSSVFPLAESAWRYSPHTAYGPIGAKEILESGSIERELKGSRFRGKNRMTEQELRDAVDARKSYEDYSRRMDKINKQWARVPVINELIHLLVPQKSREYAGQRLYGKR